MTAFRSTRLALCHGWTDSPLWERTPGVTGNVDLARLPASDDLRQRLRDWNERCGEILSTHGFDWPDEQTSRAIVAEGSALADALRAELGIEIVYTSDGVVDVRDKDRAVATTAGRHQLVGVRSAVGRHLPATSTATGARLTNEPAQSAPGPRTPIMDIMSCQPSIIATDARWRLPVLPSALPPLIRPAQPPDLRRHTADPSRRTTPGGQVVVIAWLAAGNAATR